MNIWEIFVIFSTVLLVILGIFLLFSKKIIKDSVTKPFVVLLLLIATTFAAYVPKFFVNLDFISAIFGNIVNVLHIIAIDADISSDYEMLCASAIGSYPYLVTWYMVIFGIVNITLPIASAVVAVTTILSCYSAIRLLFANRHDEPMYVFSEYNESTLQLAKSCVEKQKCYIVFASSDRDSLKEDQSEYKRFIFKDEKIYELSIKNKNKDKDVFFICDSEDDNESLNCALRLIEKYSNKSNCSEDEQKRIHIYHFSNYEDFSIYIDSAEKGELDVQCINEYEFMIYKLLDDYPILKYANNFEVLKNQKVIHVLLFGLTKVNEVALKTILWCGQLSGYYLKISVVGEQIEDQINEFKFRCPGIFNEDRYHIDFYNCNNKNEMFAKVSEKCANANYIIVSGSSDNDTMDSGIILRKLFYRLDPNFKNCPAIFCYVRESAKANILRNLKTSSQNEYNLYSFGDVSDIYNYETIINSNWVALAKNVHLRYTEVKKDGNCLNEKDVEKAIKIYNKSESNKRKSLANALHIRYKLNSVGLDYEESESTSKESVDFSAYFGDETLEKVKIAEHNRWMAFLEIEGWITANIKQVRLYQAANISNNATSHISSLLNMHPYICDYNSLNAVSQELEQCDTTEKDEVLIKGIPDILSDKWNASGKKFKIVKIDKK